MLFRLKRGGHGSGGGDQQRRYFWNDPKNNVVETDVDLVKAFGPDKFERLPDRIALTEVIDQTTQSTVPVSDADGLDGMTTKELRKHAEEMGLDVSTCSNKQELVNTIRAALNEE